MKQKCFPGNLKIKIFYSTTLHTLHKYLGNVTIKLVVFTMMWGYVCQIVCQFFGLGSVCYWVCLFLGWWLCLVFGLCVCGLVVRLGIWFVCCLVGG